MIDDIKIRKANIKDLNDILRLNFDLFKKEQKEYDSSLNLKWTYKNGKDIFRDRILKKNGFIEVAEVKNKIVGYACGEIVEGQLHRKRAKYAKLRNMLIERNFRNKGIGSRLVKDFLRWCNRNKVNYIAVTAFAQNTQAIDFYRKLGFKDYNLTLEMVIKPHK